MTITMGDLADMARDREASEKADELQRAIENGTVHEECEHNLEDDSSACFNFRETPRFSEGLLRI